MSDPCNASLTPAAGPLSRRGFLQSGAGLAATGVAVQMLPRSAAAQGADSISSDPELTRLQAQQRILLKGGVVLTLDEDDYLEPNFPALSENLERLRKATDARGRRLEVVPIRQPAERRVGGRRLPLSYINFVRANGDLSTKPPAAPSGAAIK